MAAFAEGEIEVLNDKLEDLNVAGTHRFTVQDACSDSPEALSTCRTLIESLRYYDDSLFSVQEMPSKENILHAISPRTPPLNKNSSVLDIVDYLSTHLQAERLCNLNKNKNTAMTTTTTIDIDTNRGLVLFQLDRICKELHIDVASTNESETMREISRQIKSTIETMPKALIEPLPTILRGITRDSLNAEQLHKLDMINNAFIKDFTVRRRMLLKRLDVTIQSFLWGASVQGKEDEILAVINAQRKYLTETPTHYKIEDALAAPVSLINEHTKKVTGGGNNGNLVKNILIGHVPNRGGKPLSEERAKAQIAKENRWGGGGGGKGAPGKGGEGRGHENNRSNKNNKRGGGRGGGHHQKPAKKGKV